MRFYGFDVPTDMSFYWQWTTDVTEETPEGYKQDPKDFDNTYNIDNKINESFEGFIRRTK